MQAQPVLPGDRGQHLGFLFCINRAVKRESYRAVCKHTEKDLEQCQAHETLSCCQDAGNIALQLRDERRPTT